ncbi:MAG: hypothetical protein ACYCVZ_09625 [Streptosporangiaceae bacterium]
MRWPHESAITRRDDQLARTRRLSLWVAGGASAATFALTVALSSALPGHTMTKGAPAPGTGTGAGGTGTSSGQSGEDSSGGGQVAPPTHAPSQPTAPPVVSSGGS